MTKDAPHAADPGQVRHDHAAMADRIVQSIQTEAKTPGAFIAGGSAHLNTEAVLMLALALEHALLAIDQRLGELNARVEALDKTNRDAATRIVGAIDRMPG